MAQHVTYAEEEPTLADSEHVKFNATIVPPETVPAPPPPTCPAMPIPPPELPPYSHSDLIDALPTIFVGFGGAFAVGVLTGAVIFSPPE